jgi:hypothetical protein
VVVQYFEPYVDAFLALASRSSATVTALDGAGKVVWTHTLEGGFGYGPGTGAVEETYVTGLFDVVAGGGTEVLVETVGGGAGYDPIGVAGTAATVAQLTVLDGTTGTPTPFGPPIPTTSFDVPVSTTPDLDGDKVPDVAAVAASGPTTEVLALSGARGTPVWAAHGLPDSELSYPQPVGDVTGDGVTDLAVAHFPFSGSPVLASYLGGRVTLVDGKAGTVRWTRPGDLAYGVGNVDRRPGGEVLVAALLEEDAAFGVTAAAYDAAGKAVWSVRRAVSDSVLRDGGGGMISVGLTSAGDVQDDGAPDIGYGISVTPMKGRGVHDDGTIDGRTGRVLRDPVDNLRVARAALDGHGADSYTRTTSGGLLTVAAYRGDTGGRLWRTALSGGGTPWSTFAARLDRDRCMELVLAMRAGAVTTDYVLSGATGLPLWALSRSGNGAATVVHPHVRRHTRYVRTC